MLIHIGSSVSTRKLMPTVRLVGGEGNGIRALGYKLIEAHFSYPVSGSPRCTQTAYLVDMQVS